MKKYFNIFKIFTNKTNAKFGLGVCSVVLSSSVCFAAVQATSKDGKIFYISEHSFKDNQVYDLQAEIFKKINGKNFYASKSKYPISNLTMIYNNPKSGNKNLSKLEILTPDTSKEEIITAFSTLGTVSSDTQAVPSSFIPFIVTAYAQNTNATNNKLILENGELSSVYFCKPSIGDCGVPNNSQKGDRFKYLITAAFTDRGGGFNNQTILKENSYINMGVENIYTLPLNGAPYISGSVAFDGEAKDNKLILESNTKIDLHNSQYFSDEEGKDIYDERITRLMGAFGINSNLQNNKVLIDSANIVLHGPDGEYTARSTFEILGALADVNNLKKYNVSKNSVIIKNLNLDLMVNSQNKITFYDAVLFGEIYGGRTLQGNAEKNSIEVYHFNSLDHLNKNIKTHASLNLYGGYSNDGEANGNKIVFRLKKPLKISDNFYGKNYYNLYGGFATEGANFNVIDIQNDLTYEKVPQNYSDKFTVYAARTLSGKANNNTLSIKDSVISLPLYAFITSETTLDGVDYIADESNNNEVNFENIKSSKNLSLMINAKNVSNNKINYNLIQSLTEASSLGKGSKIILKATQNANNNLIKLKDCSSAAVESSCIIKADKESAFNKIIINNTAFSTASDKRQGYVGLIAGVSANSHDNIMELVNLNIDEYKNQDAIFLAPSGTSDISNFKSYNNTLYLGGELNFFKDVNIDLLSGSVFHEVNKKGKIITQILPHQEDFSKNNRLIIDTQDVKSEVVNNFENFTFILPNKIKNPILTIEKLINLPSNGSMEILTKNKPTKGKYILIQSDVGIYDGDNRLLNQQELENLLEKMKNNKNKFNYNKIEKLAKSTLKNVNFSFEVSDDAKIIYINIL